MVAQFESFSRIAVALVASLGCAAIMLSAALPVVPVA